MQPSLLQSSLEDPNLDHTRFGHALRRLTKTASRCANLLDRVANWPSYLLTKCLPTQRDLRVFRLRSGIKIEVPSPCLGEFKDILLGDIYTRGLRLPLAQGDVIDVGANVGGFALFAVSAPSSLAPESSPANLIS